MYNLPDTQKNGGRVVRYIVVHKYGSNGPFLYGAIWGPDRTKAHKFADIASAEQAAKSAQEEYFSNTPGSVIVDEFEQPEVEVAWRAVIGGDKSKVPILQAYKEKAGYQSLVYFAQVAFRQYSHELFKQWGIV
jgi:hypothetical protein